jgi:hypothetical protein
MPRLRTRQGVARKCMRGPVSELAAAKVFLRTRRR